MMQRFNTRDLRLEGEAVLLADNIVYEPRWFFGVRTGVLAYVQQQLKTRLTWIARDGRNLGYVGSDSEYTSLRLSPDNATVAVSIMARPEEECGCFILHAV